MEPLDAAIARSTRLKAWPNNGVTEEVIADAEAVLGVVFPASYRWWLTVYGTGLLDGYELQGLFPSKPSERDPEDVLCGDIVFATLRDRRLFGQPHHLLELLSYEGDEVYYLDLSQAVDGEAPVVCRDVNAPDLDVDAPTFEAFLRKRL